MFGIPFYLQNKIDAIAIISMLILSEVVRDGATIGVVGTMPFPSGIGPESMGKDTKTTELINSLRFISLHPN